MADDFAILGVIAGVRLLLMLSLIIGTATQGLLQAFFQKERMVRRPTASFGSYSGSYARRIKDCIGTANSGRELAGMLYDGGSFRRLWPAWGNPTVALQIRSYWRDSASALLHVGRDKFCLRASARAAVDDN